MTERNILAEIKQITRRKGFVKLWIDDGELRKITKIPVDKFDKLFPKGTTTLRMCVDIDTKWVKSISPNNISVFFFVEEDSGVAPEKVRMIPVTIHESFHENGMVTMLAYDANDKRYRTIPKINEKKFFKLFNTFDVEKKEVTIYVDMGTDSIIGISYCAGDKIALPSPEEIAKTEEAYNRYHHNHFV